MVPADSTGIPRVPAYSGTAPVSSEFRVRGSHLLRPAVPDGSAIPPTSLERPFNPGSRVATPPVWANPLSLAATRGIVFTFFSCGYLDVSVPRVRLLLRMTGSLPPGCPIRISAHQRVFAPPRGFSQLVTSFIASESPGIPHAPLPHSVVS